MIIDLLGISIAGGMFVVPLYAFLTTTVAKSQTARTIAANNIVNSGAMVIGAIIYSLLVMAGGCIKRATSPHFRARNKAGYHNE